ncbi:hypothetical protein CRG98_050339, partial [Punica granatum]
MEEMQKGVARGREETGDAAAFIAGNSGRNFYRSSCSLCGKVGHDRSNCYQRLNCTHCGKTGHEKSDCFQLIGYPQDWEQRKKSVRKDVFGSTNNQHKQGRFEGAGGKKSVAGTPTQGQHRTAFVAHNGASESRQTGGATSLTEEQVQQLLSLLATTENRDQLCGMYSKLYGRETNWILDTGASLHLTGSLDNLIDPVPIRNSYPIWVPDGRSVLAKMVGDVRLGPNFILKNVFYVPEFTCNLISVGKLTRDLNCSVMFFSDFCVIQDLAVRRPIGVARLRGGLYCFGCITSFSAFVAKGLENQERWHRRLGHPSYNVLSLVPAFGITEVENKTCDICFRAKQTRFPFPPSINKSENIFDLIHCDIWGPYHTASLSGAHYFLTIVDDHSRATWVYLMREKSETMKRLMEFCNMAHTQFGRAVKVVRTDNGTEFLSKVMREFYLDRGIMHQTTCVETPQQNGMAERKHRHILNVARALRFNAELPLKFWGECVLTATYLINYTPTPVLSGKSPYEILFGKPPSYNHLRIFGSSCYALHKPKSKDKFADRSRRCIFIGYPNGKKGWKLYDLDTEEVFVSRDVVFYEDSFPFVKKEAQEEKYDQPSIQELIYSEDRSYELKRETAQARTIVMEMDGGNGFVQNSNVGGPVDNVAEQTNQEAEPSNAEDWPGPRQHPQPEQVELGRDGEEESHEGNGVRRRSHRETKVPSHFKDFVMHTQPTSAPPRTATPSLSSGKPYPLEKNITFERFSNEHRVFLASLNSETEPKTYSEAVCDDRWRNAMLEEIRALEKNGTWIVEQLPARKRPIGCKWVYKIKRRADGSVERYKARLVAKGFTQIEGQDFHETFAPVAKLVTVRCLLTIALSRGWALHQLDVNNAFLHGDLDEEVYMEMPPGFEAGKPGSVCRLKKSLYGLRQASRNWFSKFADALQGYGFIQSGADHSLFTWSKGGDFLVVLVYVDDLILTGNSKVRCAAFKEYLRRCFHIKDLGPLKYFLGIEVARRGSEMFLCQRKYTLDILADSGMMGAKPVLFPMEQQHGLRNDSGDRISDPSQYRRLV